MDLDSYIEAILFLEGEPVKIKKLAEVLNKQEKDINSALETLEQKLENRGVKLVKKDNEVMLSTAPEATKICEEISKEEFNRDIGKAGLEVLAIVVYRNPVGRADIDYIRGVNSSFTLRNLMVRGLIERTANPKDGRSYLYRPSFRLLQFLGIENIKELPDYDNFRKVSEDSSLNIEQIQLPEFERIFVRTPEPRGKRGFGRRPYRNFGGVGKGSRQFGRRIDGREEERRNRSRFGEKREYGRFSERREDSGDGRFGNRRKFGRSFRRRGNKRRFR